MATDAGNAEPFVEPTHPVSPNSPGATRTAQAWPRPIRDGHWVDDSGVSWHRRGREIEPGSPALRRLLKRSGLRVLHAYGAHPHEVDGDERETLLERLERHGADFSVAEFRNQDRHVLLVIEETC